MPRQRGVRPTLRACFPPPPPPVPPALLLLRSCVHWLTRGRLTTVTPASRTARSVVASSSGDWKARELQGGGEQGLEGGQGVRGCHWSVRGRVQGAASHGSPPTTANTSSAPAVAAHDAALVAVLHRLLRDVAQAAGERVAVFVGVEVEVEVSLLGEAEDAAAGGRGATERGGAAGRGERVSRGARQSNTAHPHPSHSSLRLQHAIRSKPALTGIRPPAQPTLPPNPPTHPPVQKQVPVGLAGRPVV